MLTLHAKDFVNLLATLMHSEQMAVGKRGTLSDEMRQAINQAADVLEQHCGALELPVSMAAIAQLRQITTCQELSFMLTCIRNTVTNELGVRKFYGPMQQHAQYFDQPALFGDAVFNTFPEANDDIAEAGTCLALGRSTACVMHLMRALEAALMTVAGQLGVPRQPDWSRYLKEMDKALAGQAQHGVGPARRAHYAEAIILFDHVRRAWRNPTMHVEKQYDPGRAEEILRAVRTLLQHLASRPVAD